jgi:hypothetical protein
MTAAFGRATPEEFEELVDLANYVFSHGGGRVDFPSLLPKLYNPVYRTAPHHVVAREGGRIRAMVGAFPIPVSVAGESLLACGIGTVCVHPYRRGSGYMKTLMRMAHDDMRQAGADFGCLSGQRQRYRYFGYDRCGQMMLFEINRANLRHAYGPDGAPKRTFRQLGPQDPALADCRTLHAARPLHVIREPERFLDILKSWDSQAWVIAREDVFEGYLVASRDGAQVHELVLANPRDSADIVAAWARDRDLETVNVLVPPYDPQVILPLSRLAETMRVEAADNLAVFRFDTTVNAFFKLKATYDALPDGEVVIAVDGHPPFRMSAVDGAVRAEMTQAPAHLAMTYADALALLFSPLGGVCAAALEDGVREGPAGFDARTRALLRAWLPLPLCFDKADNV